MAKTKQPAKPWTVMVYMVAGNDAELDQVAVEDIREMERGVGLNPDDDVNVVVQINRAWPDSAQRYQVRKRTKSGHSKGDPREGISVLVGRSRGNTDMASERTLARFVTWAVDTYPANHYCLILWGHAYGLGFGRDHNNSLTLKELKLALAAFEKARRTRYRSSNGRLELLGTNACAMSYAEAIYELRDSAQFMVASQIAVPFAGWPYESILKRIDKDTDARQLGGLIVDSYVSHFNALPGGPRVTMTLLHLEKAAKKLQSVVDGLTEAIESDLTPERAASIRDVFIATATGDVRPLIDLKEVCTVLSESGLSRATNAERRVAALMKVKGTLEELVDKHELVVEHESHPSLKDVLHGVGIYAPFVTDEKDLRRLELSGNNGNTSGNGNKSGRAEYEGLELFKNSQAKVSWPRLVYDGLRQEIPSELMMRIQDIGVMNRNDRADLAQIIMSIESSFNVLDRVMAAARQGIVGELKTLGDPAKMKAARELAKKRERKEYKGYSVKFVPVEKQKKSFGLPWLQLLASSSKKEDGTVRSSETPAKKNAFAHPESVSVTNVVGAFEMIERVLRRVEKATRTGVTNAEFGLGPSGLDQVSVFNEDPKDGQGAPREGSFEDPKDGQGPPTNGATSVKVFSRGDLRGDLALARVQELFGQVGQSLRALEQALTTAEITASRVLSDSASRNGLTSEEYFDAAEKRMSRAFRILEESSTTARRTVRRVLHHPVYGLGPGPRGLRLDEREELARAGGLDGRSLELL